MHNFNLCGLFGGIALVGLFGAIAAKSSSIIACFLLLLSIFGAWYWYGFYDRFHCFSAVIPKYRVDSPGFLKRNRDKILVSVISLIVGAAIAYLVK